MKTELAYATVAAAMAATLIGVAIVQIGCSAQAKRRAPTVQSASSTETTNPQATCPVMGGKIDKDLFVDAEGYRIYVCCQGCVSEVKQNPKKYLKKISENGEIAEKVAGG